MSHKESKELIQRVGQALRSKWESERRMTQAAMNQGTDLEYTEYLRRLQDRFETRTAAGTEPLFNTDAAGLWDLYLAGFSPDERQYHNCNSCRHFIERFGALVVIADDGLTTSAFWDVDDAPLLYRASVEAIERAVRKAKVTGPFLSSDRSWGTASNVSAKGVTWTHLHLDQGSRVYRGAALTAGQAMAEKVEDRKNICRALAEFDANVVTQAVQLLETDSLYRSEKVAGPAKFLAAIHAAKATAKNHGNVIWKMTATAPAGFCHPRSSMVGTLLEDLAAGKSFDDVARAFKSKMHPLQYQRPQAAPSTGAIEAAEKLVEKLGIGPSLERRFARVEEIQALWSPTAAPEPSKAGGVFGHLKSQQAASVVTAPASSITFDKFARTVLSTGGTLSVVVPGRGNYGAIVTAANDDAPPILQWDSAERRNPFSWYVWNGGSSAESWGLRSGASVPVAAITEYPAHWFGGTAGHHARRIMFVLEGARETKQSGNALFPETLKSELHGVRSVVEAYSKRAELLDMANGSACGLILGESSPVRVVHTLNGVAKHYLIDRVD